MAINNPIIFICGQDIRHNASLRIVEETLKLHCWTVINPQNVVEGLCECSYLPVYLALLEAADAIYVLPGADDFECKTLINYASAQGISILHTIQDAVAEREHYNPLFGQQTFMTLPCQDEVEMIWNGREYEWVSRTALSARQPHQK